MRSLTLFAAGAATTVFIWATWKPALGWALSRSDRGIA